MQIAQKSGGNSDFLNICKTLKKIVEDDLDDMIVSIKDIEDRITRAEKRLEKAEVEVQKYYNELDKITDMKVKEEFAKRLTELSEKAGICDLAIPACDKLYTICEQLDLKSKQFNLTAITEPEEVLKKHIIDCIFTAKTVGEMAGEGAKLLDVGSGAGFPSLPIAAVLPDLFVNAMDSTAKKCVYMNDTAFLAGIDNFNAFCLI